MRINKFLAECGLASRRASEKLIQDGLVKINGVRAELGSDVDLQADTVTVSGRKVSLPRKHTYIVFHKPKGCVTTASDDKGRKTIFDFVRLENVRLFPVGRLDYDTEGLLLLTNDGEICNKLMHPSNHIGKTYVAKVEGELTQDDVKALLDGVELDDGEAEASRVRVLEVKDGLSKVEITIFEGRNRQIKRMFESIGKNVVFLKRTKVGEIRLGGLPRGDYRYLNEREMKYLRELD